MTIQDALSRVDLLKPNMQSVGFKIDYLSQIDAIIHRELLMKHEMNEAEEWPEEFEPYDEGTDRGTELLVPFPYDEDLYTFWLMSKVDIQNQELDKYANDRTLFNNAYETFSDWLTRTHMPISAAREFHL